MDPPSACIALIKSLLEWPSARVACDLKTRRNAAASGTLIRQNEGKPRYHDHLGGIVLMAEPALLELDELDLIGICCVRGAQRCVHCTPEQRRKGKVLMGCWWETELQNIYVVSLRDVS